MRRYDHRTPSIAFIAVTVVAFIVVAACAAHAIAVATGRSDPLPGIDPFAAHHPALGHRLQTPPSHPVAHDGQARVHAGVVRDQVTHGVGLHRGHSEPRGQAHGHVTHQPPKGHAYGWAPQPHGQALAKGHLKQQ